MVTATQIIPQKVDASAQSGNQDVSDAGDLFKALFSTLSSANVPDKASQKTKSPDKDDSQDSDPSMQAVTMELISALLQNTCAPAAENVQGPVTEGAAVADVLEGSGSSGGMDIATLMPGLQNAAEGAALEQGGETEDVKARMPQIMELLNATVTSTEKETEVCPDDRPCPLESVSEAVAADGGKVSKVAEDPGNSAQPILTDEGTISAVGGLQGTADSADPKDSSDRHGEQKRTEPEVPERRTQNISGSPGPASVTITEKLSTASSQNPPQQSRFRVPLQTRCRSLRISLRRITGRTTNSSIFNWNPKTSVNYPFRFLWGGMD